MFEILSLAKATEIVTEAATAWKQAATRDDASKVIANYGRLVGYKPIVKVLVLGKPLHEALKVYGAVKPPKTSKQAKANKGIVHPGGNGAVKIIKAGVKPVATK